MNRPVILCGFGKVGRHVLECLRSDDVAVVVIDLKKPANLPAQYHFVAGDCRQKSVLEQAGVASARGVIICTSDDLVNLATALVVRSLSPDVRIVVRTFNPRLVPRLGKAMSNVIALSVSALSAPLLAQVARTGSALGSVPTPDGLRPVAEVTITEGHPLVGISVTDAAGPTLPLAWLPADSKPRILSELTGDEVLSTGDRLAICGRPADVAALTGDDHTTGTDDVRWAGWLRRQWRAVVRTLDEVERPVRIAFMVLASILVLSTCVYCLHGESLAAAFYHTVCVMATGGDLNAEQQSAGFKTFVSVLKLTGAALLAAFTAIFTNYLVRARLGALELRRIPDAGHVVVCGLGNVGFRVVEELLRAGQSVVVIEANRDNTFLSTARQLGAAVVVGNCTVIEALKQAKVETARSVVCATNSDLINVESALLVRELNPAKRVVVRLADADMAQALRDAANVRLAVSIPALAAPAFAAALYGDRLDALFLIGGRLLTAVEISVEAGEANIDGEHVNDLIANYGLKPVYLRTRDGKTPANIGEHQLAAGDRLTAILSLSDLDRLYRREPKSVA